VDNMQRLCPKCNGYLVGDPHSCPYCGYAFGRPVVRLGFYTLLLILFVVLMGIALLLKGPSRSYIRSLPHLRREKIKSVQRKSPRYSAKKDAVRPGHIYRSLTARRTSCLS